jgi:RNA polymerase sigma-70 factor (ECF subfamily)
MNDSRAIDRPGTAAALFPASLPKQPQPTTTTGAMSAWNDETTDERLVQSVLDGDDDAFAELVRRHKRKIFGMAARFARNDHELDDICQEVFVKAYRNIRSYRGDAPFEHWLSRIAAHACCDFLRKTRRDRANLPLDLESGVTLDVPVEDNTAPARAREILEFAMARLSAEERLVITLLELEERTVKDIASLTGWSESNVKVRAFRARKSLKRVLESHHER